MPLKTLVLEGWIWLTRVTYTTCKLAAVSMIIQNMLIRANIGTWWNCESHWEDSSTIKPTIHIVLGSWLEPHDGLGIICLVFTINFAVGWLKVLVVEFARDTESWVSYIISWIWLIQRIIADYIRVSRKSSGGVIPESYKFVSKTIDISEKSSKASDSLLCVIVVGKHLLEAVLDKRISIFIQSVPIAVHVIADTELIINWSEQFVNCWRNTGWTGANNFFRIKVWDTLAAHGAGKHILVSIYESVDASLTHLVDQNFDLVEVVVVIDATFAFDSFPHDAKTDKIHAPLLQVGNVLVVQGALRVE